MRGLFMVFGFLVLCPGFAGPVVALEMISYEKSLPVSAGLRLADWISHEIGTDIEQYSSAEADLNRDGLSEYILKPQKCYDPNGFCTFFILAETPQQIVLLGKISARKLALGDSYHAGVQDILAFRSNNNDYEYDIFVWDSPSKAYVLSGRTEG